MKLAIMQPYFFPYIGYFQLIKAADKMILYDLVTYRKGSWMNRNRLIDKSKNSTEYFRVPVRKFSIGTLASDILIDETSDWRAYYERFIYFNYRKAPQFSTVFPLVLELLNIEAQSLHEFNSKSIMKLARYMNLHTEIVFDNSDYLALEEDLVHNGQDANTKTKRIIKICQNEGADHYINPIGGISLYDKETFANHKLKLSFLTTGSIVYKQFTDTFEANLSIIDLLMHNNIDRVNTHLNNYSLV